MKLTKEERMQIIGEMGEKIVKNYLSMNHKARIIASVNHYDSTCDITVYDTGKYDGKAEIKTQVPFLSKNLYTVDENQMYKILNSDGVFFVNIGNKSKKWPDPKSGHVLFLRNPKESKDAWTNYFKEGKRMCGLSRDYHGLEYVFTVDEKDGQMLIDYSVSGLN